MDKKVVFPDTNILLHFRSYDQIDWPGLLDAREVDLVFPPITLRELQKHKTFHAIRRIKQRAGEMLSNLDKAFENGPDAEVRPGVRVRHERRNPWVDFADLGLDPSDQDHQHLASILSYQKEHPEEAVVFVTNDVGAKYTALGLGIAVWVPGDDLALKEEPDPLEKEVAQLRRENEELKRRIPVVDLAFSDGHHHLRLEKHAAFMVFEGDLTSEMVKVYQENWPLGVENPHLPPQAAGQRRAAELHNFYDSHSGQPYRVAAQYNADVRAYHGWIERYHRDILRHQSLLERIVILELCVTVRGSAPAENVDIYLTFPAGVSILTDAFLPDMPLRPPVPVVPESPRMQTTHFPVRESQADSGMLAFYKAQEERKHTKQLDQSYERTRVQSGSEGVSVTVGLGDLKHLEGNRSYPMPPLYVEFPTFEEMKSFGFGYEISANNLPSMKKGRLDVVIEKGEPVSAKPGDLAKLLDHWAGVESEMEKETKR